MIGASSVASGRISPVSGLMSQVIIGSGDEDNSNTNFNLRSVALDSLGADSISS